MTSLVEGHVSSRGSAFCVLSSYVLGVRMVQTGVRQQPWQVRAGVARLRQDDGHIGRAPMFGA